MTRIGIFDSGVGGLTVQRAILEAAPGVETVYLGDTARVPYGTKSPEVVTQYSLHNARFLLGHAIDMLVVACNTASAAALKPLRAAFPGVPFSVRSTSYSGGSSVWVKWTDGPSKGHVDDALSGFAGHDFDGSIDMSFSHSCYMTRTGTVGYAGTSGTAGSMGSVPAVKNDVPYGATIVHFMPYIFTDRALTGTLPDFGDYWAWKAINDTDRPAAPVRRY